MFHFLLWLVGALVFAVYLIGVLLFTFEGLMFDEGAWASFRGGLTWPYHLVWPELKDAARRIAERIRAFFG